MVEVSNKTLAILVSLAIVISLAGIVMTPKASITGFYTVMDNQTYGLVQADITSELIITLVSGEDLVNFSTGRVAAGYTYCTLETNKTPEPSGCNVAWKEANRFRLRNDGNINATIYMNNTNNVTTWFTTTGGDLNLNQYAWNMTDLENGTCRNLIKGGEWTAFNMTEVEICHDMDFSETNDTMQIHIRINVTENIKDILGLDNVTFIGTMVT